ncbi:hypothetical protein [Actinospongicola halichondriae]|uniref:hypothetical protein n=1 Tax=Actinospongicola halichondriae TaxID=3236844 RepID=UPI003D3E2CC4
MGYAGMDLESMEVRDLLSLSSGAVAELRRRGIVRTNNAPLGDYAEWLAVKALGGKLAPNSERSFDLVTDAGRRVQVKARRVSDPPEAGQLQTSPFRSWDFDDALLLLVDEATYWIRSASVVPLEVVKEVATYREHVNGSTVQMTADVIAHRRAIDVTERLRAVLADAPIPTPSRSDPDETRRPRSRPLRAVGTQRGSAPGPELPDPVGAQGVDWIWLQNSAIDEFKAWRIQGGATQASASSYTAGAKRYARFCRGADLDPHHSADRFHAHLIERDELATGSISDYRSHARAFIRFLDAIHR